MTPDDQMFLTNRIADRLVAERGITDDPEGDYGIGISTASQCAVEELLGWLRERDEVITGKDVVAERIRARRQVIAVRKLHRRPKNTGEIYRGCVACNRDWPCPTITDLEAAG